MPKIEADDVGIIPLKSNSSVEIFHGLQELDKLFSSMNPRDLEYVIAKISHKLKKPGRKERQIIIDNFMINSPERASDLDDIANVLLDTKMVNILHYFDINKYEFKLDHSIRMRGDDHVATNGVYTEVEFWYIADRIEKHPLEFTERLGYNLDTVIPYRKHREEYDGTDGTLFWFGENVVVDSSKSKNYPFCKITKLKDGFLVNVYLSPYSNDLRSGSLMLPMITISKDESLRIPQYSNK